MASTAASETIFFIAALVLSTSLAGVFGAVAQHLGQDVQDRGHQLSRTIRAEIVIINDPRHVEPDPLTLYVKNVGSDTLFPPETLVLLDGQIVGTDQRDVLGTADDDVWEPGQVLELTQGNLTLAAGDHTVRVVADGGVFDELQFAS